MQYKWPLNLSNLTWLDRLKICKFFLNPNNRLTQGKYTDLLERQMAEFVGCNYSVVTSSGSTANTILAMNLRDTYNKNKNIVVFPSVSWQTSYSPFIREGFEPKFIDISLEDFSMDLNLLEEYLKKNKNKVALVFVTTLLGFAPDIKKLSNIQDKYKIKIMLDNCEANLTENKDKFNVSSKFTSTTSMYFGHHLQASEMGFIFTNNKEEYKRYLLYRNHGMVRSLIREDFLLSAKEYRNELVDSRFDFCLLGNNFRNSDINSFIGLLDFERRSEYTNKRRLLYDIYYTNLNSDRYILPYYKSNDVAFSLPIICKGNNSLAKERKEKILNWCEENSIETRPVVSANILRQTPYQKYDDYKNYPIAELLTNKGCYVGLHTKLKEKDILFLTSKLNKL